MANRELRVTLETVTPMFMAGINQNSPELRPPSILGPLRYWLRAALGAVVGDDLKALKQAEAEVFGDTDGTGAVQLKRVRWMGELPKPVRENALPHPSARSAYMWGFPANKKFELTLTQHTTNESTWLAAISALFLMISIGGLGRRCRRGWGTVRIIEYDTAFSGLTEFWQQVLTSDPLNFNTALDMADRVIEQLSKDLDIAKKPLDIPTEYTIVSPKLMSVFFNDNHRKKWTNYQDAISDFGENEHNWLQANPNLEKSIGSAMGGRQASPLWLRVLPLTAKNGTVKYIMLATLFDVDFKGANYKAVQKFLKSANFEEVK